MTTARCSIDVRGLVQGVGFRPFVHGLAQRHALAGMVHNGPSGVHIEVEGGQVAIDGFVAELWRAPSPAAVEHVSCRPALPRGETEFRIEKSAETGEMDAFIPADLATCDACVRELFDRDDRRFGHAFISCTHCGPRATIITGMPYDRERTTMNAFALCARCRTEYEAPQDRRFHAQPIACPRCWSPKIQTTFGRSGGAAANAAVPTAPARNSRLRISYSSTFGRSGIAMEQLFSLPCRGPCRHSSPTTW